jgi:L-lactate utilization protein LutB
MLADKYMYVLPIKTSPFSLCRKQAKIYIIIIRRDKDMVITTSIQNTINSLTKKNINAYFAETKIAAFELILTFLKENMTIASGNSLTLRQIGIFDYLASSENPYFCFINQFEPGITPEENLKIRKQGLTADLYLSSANAITEDGKICNIDGKGNRVAALMFGPEKVIIVVGKNKIVKDEHEAWERIRRTAAPLTAKRLKRTTPCTVVGICQNCNSPERICRAYSMIDGQMPQDKDRIHVIIVGEDLGT